MSGARNHHFVPQGYLRGFAGGINRRARFWATDLSDGRSFGALVRDVGARRDFNRVEVDGHHPNVLEDAYAEFENQSIPAIARTVERGTFEGDDKLLVLNLVALLAVRHPRMRATWADFMDRVWRGMGKLIVSKKEIWESTTRQMVEAGYNPATDVEYERMRKFVESDEYDIEVHRNEHARIEIGAVDAVLPYLVGRRWHLYLLNEGICDLVTSDDPVCLMSTVRRPAGPLGALGFGLKNTAVMFPLTRRAAIWGTFEGDHGTHKIDRWAAAEINTRVAAHAFRQVYSYDLTFEYLSHGRLRDGRSLARDPSFRKRGE